MAAGSKVKVQVLGDSSDAVAAFKDTEKQAEKSAAEIRDDFRKANDEWAASTGRTVEIVSAGMMTAGKAMTVAFTLPLAALGVASIKAAMDYESAMAGVRKTTDATEAEFESLGQAAQRMSEQKVVSTSQVLDIMALGSQLGVAKEELENFSSTIADLDVSTNLNAEEGATQFAQFANIVKMSQADFSRLGSTIVDLGNNMATTEAAIMAMGMRIGGAGSQIGLTADQIMGVSAALASVGIEAEAGGTAISTIMSQIDKDVATNSDTLKVWASTAGMSAEQFSEAWKTSPIAALQALFRGMSDASESGQNLNLVLDSLGVTSLRQTDVMKRLTNAADLLGSSVDIAGEAWQKNTALTTEAQARYKTTESQLAMLKNEMENIAATMGGPLIVGIRSFITSAQPALDMLKAMATGFAELPAPAQGGIVAITGFAAAIGPTLMLTSKMLSMTKSWSEGIRGLRLAMLEGAAAQAVNTTATAASATASGADAMAKTADTAATGALTVATSGLSVAWRGLTAAMATNPIGAIAIGVGLLVTGFVALSAAMAAAEDRTEHLTDSSRRQKDELDELQSRYDDLTDAEKQNVKIGGKLKVQIDESTEAYEANKMTVEELDAAIKSAAESHKEWSDSLNTALTEEATHGAALDNLVSRYVELTGKQGEYANRAGLTSDEQAELKSISEQLVGSVEGLSGAYDSATGSINLTTDAIVALTRAQVIHAQNEERLDGLKSAYEELEKASTAAAVAQGEYDEAYKRYEKDLGGYTDAYARYVSGLDEADKKLQRANGEVKKWQDSIRETNDKVKEYYESQQAANDAIEKYGYSLEDVTAALGEDSDAVVLATEAIGEHEIAVLQAKEAIEDYADASPEFAQAMADAGYTSETLQARLEELGLGFDDLTAAIETTVEKATSGFDRLSTEGQASLDEVMANLAENAKVTSEWATNVETAYDKATTDGAQRYVQWLESQGVERAGKAMADMASLTPEQIAQKASEWEAAGGTIVDSLYSAEIIGKAGKGGEALVAEEQKGIETGAKTASDGLKTTGKQMGDTIESGVKEGFSNAEAYAYGSELGRNLSSGLLSEVPSLESASLTAAEALAKYIKHSIPIPESPLHDEALWMDHMADNLVSGLRANEGRLIDEVYVITSKMAEGFEHLTDAGYVIGEGVPLRETGLQYAGGSAANGPMSVSNTYLSIDGMTFNDSPRIIALANELLSEYLSIVG